MKKIDYKKGDKIGNCIYLKEVSPFIYIHKKTNKKVRSFRQALLQCPCGKEFEGVIDFVKRGGVQSCGCLNDYRLQQLSLRNSSHNKSKHLIYKTWVDIIRRCNVPKNKSYHNYGGRGIKVCERWFSIDNFIADMYPTYIKGLDIDRIDNDGDYEPSNCRWVTRKKNSNNKRSNRVIKYKGMEKTVSEWSQYCGIPYQTLRNRLASWKIEEVFTIPYPCSKKLHQY